MPDFLQPRFRILATALITWIAFLATSGPLAAPALAQTGLSLTAEAGLDGYCKEGEWLPVRITVENKGEQLEGSLFARTTGLGDTWQFRREISLPAVSRKEVTLYLFPLGRPTEVEVGVASAGSDIIVRQIPITCVPAGDLLLGVWAAAPSVFNAQISITAPRGRPTIALLEASDFPDRPQGLAMLDAVTLSDVDGGKLTTAQRAALAAWVSNGGRLLIAGGVNWQATSAGLSDLLPLTPTGTRTLPDLNSLPAFLKSGGAPDGSAIVATGDLHPDAQVLISQDGTPLIIERRRGFGAVIYLAADPALEPLRMWAGIGELYQFLIGTPPDAPAWRNGFQEWSAAGEALNAIPGLGMPSVWLVCGFIVLYILVIGPVNFTLLRILKRRELSWLSVPAVVLSFTGIIFLIGATLAGSRPVVNRLAIVEVWPGSDQALAHALVGVFSPKRDTFTLGVDSGFIAHPLPDPGFNPGGRVRIVTQTDSGFEISDLRVDIGGLEGYAVSGLVDAPSFRHNLTLTLGNGTAARLQGEIRNDSRLDLQDAMILTASSSKSLGDLGAGEKTSLSMSLPNRGATASGPAQGFGPAFSGDDTLLEIFGTNYMYASSFVDIEDIRRFNLLRSAMGGLNGARGGGIFLIGWTTEAPFQTTLTGGNPRHSDTTMYIIQLDPALDFSSSPDGTFRLDPEHFSWALFGSPNGLADPSAYDASITSGDYALQFTPLFSLTYSDVQSLTLQLSGFGKIGPAEMTVSLWDFESGAWVEQDGMVWGENPIEEPGRFVGPGGEIRLQIAYSSERDILIERSDFSLVVRH